MKFNKLMIVSIILLAVLTIGAVSASDDLSGGLATGESDISYGAVGDVSDESPDLSANVIDNLNCGSDSNSAEDLGTILYDNNDSKVKNEISDGNIKLFSEINTRINNAVEGSTIDLFGEEYVGDEGPIEIYKPLTINGHGAVLDGKDLSLANIIYVTSDNVVIKDITFKNGACGAITSLGNNSAIMNCTFIKNSHVDGGAIYSEGNDVIIQDCRFIDNLAEAPFVGEGGAIYSLGSNYTIQNCTFINNTAQYSGGAIYFNGENCNIIGSTFIMNDATKSWGGAILFYGDYYNRGIIMDCTFINNTAHSGGAIYSPYSTTIDFYNYTIINCIFTNNSADSGGAIENVAVNCTIINSTFTNNHANSTGGAIDSVTNVINCSFTNNACLKEGTGNGGAIQYAQYVFNCSFTNNAAGYIGGALTYSVYIINSTFTNNNASWDGGAVYTAENIINSAFTSNNAGQDGGAVFTGSSGEEGYICNITNCLFTDNTAVRYGGAICYAYISHSDLTYCNITDSIFMGNSAGTGGALYSESSNENITIMNSIFTDNSAGTAGAAYLYVDSDIINSLFTNNLAENASAIYLHKGNIINSTFANNSAQNTGAIETNGFGLTVTDCDFTDNTVSECGGAICVTGLYTDSWYYKSFSSYIINSTFINNYAEDGGAIYVNSSYSYYMTVYVTDCTFTNSTVSPSKGVNTDDAVVYTNCVFDGVNSSEINGNSSKIDSEFEVMVGDVEYGEPVEVEIFFSNVDSGMVDVCVDESDSMSVLFVEGYASFSLNLDVGYHSFEVYYPGDETYNAASAVVFCTVLPSETGNGTSGGDTDPNFDALRDSIENAGDGETIELSGNLISVSDNIGIFKSLTINGNGAVLDAKGRSSIFYISSGCNVTIRDIVFMNANAHSGSAILIDEDSYVEIINCTFINCQARGDDEDNRPEGGAIRTASDCYIADCSFTNCHSDSQSGAIHLCGQIDYLIENSNFTNCHSNEDGGAVQSLEGNDHGGSIVNCIFRDCSSGWGGAAKADYGTHSIINSTFTDCSAGWGGAVSYYRADANIEGCTFENCNMGPDSEGRGGAVNLRVEGNYIITDSSFTNCKAMFGGGVDYDSENVYEESEKSLTISDCTFTNCHADELGGAIHSAYGAEVIDCEFTNCTTDSSGNIDGIFSGVTFTNCIIYDISDEPLNGTVDVAEEELSLWVNVGEDISTAPEDLYERFANVVNPQASEGTLVISIDGNDLYRKAIRDWNEDYIDGKFYNIALGPDGNFIFEGLNNEDVIKIAFLNEDGDEVTSREFIIFLGENTIKFEDFDDNHDDEKELEVGFWDENDERGTLYTDSEGWVMYADVCDGSEGTIFIIINGDDENPISWDIECDEWEDYPYHQWHLEDLNIGEAGQYNITVKCNDDVIAEGTLNVVEFNNDEYRFYIDYGEENFRLYVPEGSIGTAEITLELQDEEGEFYRVNEDDITREITSEDEGYYIYWDRDDLDIENDKLFYLTLTVRDSNENQVYRYAQWFSFGGGGYDGPIDEIELVSPDEIYERGENVVIAYLYIPDNGKFDDAVITVNITKNGNDFLIVSTSDLESTYDEVKEAKRYDIAVDLTQVEEKDLLFITFNGGDDFDDCWSYVVQIIGDNVGLWDCVYIDSPEFYVFYGNITKGDINDPEAMGPHPDGHFIEIIVPDASNITDGTLIVTDGENIILNKTLSEFNKGDYDYGILGYSYVIDLNEFDLYTLPENKTLTFSFTSGNTTVSDKRIRFGDFVFIYNNIERLSKFFIIDASDELLTSGNDTAVSIFGTDNLNPMSVWIDAGRGWFYVYVDGVKVENLSSLIEYDGEDGEDDEISTDIELSALGHESRHEFYLTVDNLGISKNGIYNIRVVQHSEDVDVYNPEDNYFYNSDTEMLNKNITVIFGGIPELVDSELNLTDSTVDYGNSAIINVTYSGATGITDVKVFDEEENEIDANITVGDGIITVSGLGAGVYTLVATTVPDEYHNAVNASADITVNKVDSTVSADDIVFDYGESGSTTVSYTGATDVFAGMDDHPEVVINQTANVITVSGLDAGVYNLTIITVPDANHDSVSTTVTVTVNKVDSTVSVGDIAFDYGASGYADVAFTGATGVAAIVVNHTEAVVSVADGKVTVSGLDAGNYVLSVSTVPDANHDSVTTTATVTVNKIASTLSLGDILIDYGNSGVSNVAYTGATGITDVKVLDEDEIEVAANVTLGDGVITVSGLDAGVYTLVATTVPDGNHEAVSAGADITVNKVDSTVSADDIVFNFGSSGSTTASYTGATDVFAGMDDHPEVVINQTGDVITVSGLAVGIYNLTIITVPDANHNAVSTVVTVTVNKAPSTVSVGDIAFDYGASGSADITYTGATSVSAGVVNHTEAIVSIADGKVTVSGLDAGSYVLSLSTVPDANHSAASTTAGITVNKVDSTLTVNAITFTYGANGSSNVTYAGATGITAGVVNHTEAVVTVADGQITVSGLAAGNYQLMVSTTADASHNSVSATANITVNKAAVAISAPKVTATYAVSKNLVITVKSGGKVLANKKVSVTVGSIKKTLKTNAKGQLSVKVSSLVPKTYTATVKFAGDENYTAKAVKATVVVKKNTPKITAKTKTFKRTAKTKSYSITIKNSKNKAIKGIKAYIKVNGVTYSATSNAKGIATFKINKLTKKGSFKSTITVKATKYYNKVTKKVTIKAT